MRRIPLLILAVALSSASRAAPPQDANPAFSPWFESLERPDVGGSCCSISDCRRVQSRVGTRGYEVLLDDAWVPVPPYRVVHRENPVGEAISCARGHVIICFVPPPET